MFRIISSEYAVKGKQKDKNRNQEKKFWNKWIILKKHLNNWGHVSIVSITV